MDITPEHIIDYLLYKRDATNTFYNQNFVSYVYEKGSVHVFYRNTRTGFVQQYSYYHYDNENKTFYYS